MKMTAASNKVETTSGAHDSASALITNVDLSWKGLYRAGGISAILYVLLALVIPTIQALTMEYFPSTAEYGGLEFLRFIAANRTWWLILQTLVLGTSIFPIVTFAALFLAIKHLDKSTAALGAMIGMVTWALFIAYYPVLMGTIYLSDKFITASASQQAVYAAAAEALMAINNAFNPLYEPLLAVSILLFSLVMLKGVFHKSIGFLGIATCVAAFVAVALWPVLNVNYFWWWTLLFIWLIAVGWKLLQLSKA
jgi:hypothetical protein